MKASLAAFAIVLFAAPAVAQTLAEPIPQRREPRSVPARPPAERNAMLPCPEYGPGFFRAPGSSACVQVSGRVRGEMQFRQRGSSLGDTTGTRTQARVGVDVRIPTEFGGVRAVMSGGGQRNGGDAWR